MSTSSNLSLLGLFAVILFAAAVTWHAGRKLAIEHGGDIRLVCYLFSLALTATSMVIVWARGAGAIAADGTYNGTAGTLLGRLFDFMVDVSADVKVLTVIAALVIVPQALTWLLCALFGCAKAPMFVTRTFVFVFWSMVKSFAAAAGVLTPLAIYGSALGVPGWSVRATTEALTLSAGLIAVCFGLLYLHRDIGGSEGSSGDRGTLRIWILKINAWGSRRISR